ncbi:CAP domain-containing protein [Piscinibacter sp. XHJ-5]|uniref:CAP domain-containing protein n=1 Tax=Piscinibacter sp. XHJ-5 TaxID=3037797 RepID=UPI002452CD68|nr:CAP domain-containing protein [Piscinibacter sp. XHJ-5]
MKSSRPPSVRSSVLLVPCVVILLAACGGGGSSEPQPAPPTAAAADATCGLPDFSASALARVNQVRATGATCGARGTFSPAAPVTLNARLTQAAAGHAQDMATNNYFSHTSLDGRTFSQRIDATGYQWTNVGENIAAGQATVNSVIDAWVASPDHCANMMNPVYTEIGLACVPAGSSNTYRTYWAMELGKPA